MDKQENAERIQELASIEIGKMTDAEWYEYLWRDSMREGAALMQLLRETRNALDGARAELDEARQQLAQAQQTIETGETAYRRLRDQAHTMALKIDEVRQLVA